MLRSLRKKNRTARRLPREVSRPSEGARGRRHGFRRPSTFAPGSVRAMGRTAGRVGVQTRPDEQYRRARGQSEPDRGGCGANGRHEETCHTSRRRRRRDLRPRPQLGPDGQSGRRASRKPERLRRSLAAPDRRWSVGRSSQSLVTCERTLSRKLGDLLRIRGSHFVEAMRLMELVFPPIVTGPLRFHPPQK